MDFRGFYDNIIFDVNKPILRKYTGKQGDTKSRGLYLTVTQRNVVIKDLTGLSMRLFYEKPDKTRGFIDGVVDGDKFRIDYTNQMFAVPGVVKAELRLMGADGEIITAKTFKILVDSSIADGSIVSENERGILDRAFELAEDIIPRLELLDVELLEDIQNRIGPLEDQVSDIKDDLQQHKQDFLSYKNDYATFIQDYLSHKNDYATFKDNITLKVAKVEKELNDYKATMQQINIHQSPTQKAQGYGTVSLPKNAAEGQVSVAVKGNTETDEEGNTKSTVGAMRAKSVGKNIFPKLNNVSDFTKMFRINSYERYIQNLSVINNRLKVGKKGQMTILDLTLINLEPNQQYTLSCKIEPFNKNIYRSSLLGSLIFTYQDIPNGIIRKTFTTDSNGEWNSYTGAERFFLFLLDDENYTQEVTLYDWKLNKGDKIIDEPYKESTAYIIAKDKDNKIVNLMSLPNGTKDEINVTDRKLIKRIGEKSNIANGMVIDFADMAEGGTYYAWNENGETETGIKGDTLGIDATTLTYQLAEPEIIPIQVSGNIVSNPSGTVYIENAVADAGVYNNGISIFEQELDIDHIDKLFKVEYETGVETELDANKAIISEDKKSFTHPDLQNGDMVFFEYFYSNESTQGEATVEYYDSRYVIKDKSLDKFYQWDIEVDNGVPSIKLVEV